MEIRESKVHHGISLWQGYQKKGSCHRKVFDSIQTPAMKHGLTNEFRAAKESLDYGQNKTMYKSGLVVNPAFCWLGALPDGIIYDPSIGENPFGIFEAKCPFYGVGKKIIEIIRENKQFHLKQTIIIKSRA